MWWTSLLKKLALARLAQTGVAGQIGAHYLGNWGQQEEQTPQMLTQGQSIQPVDFASGDIAPTFNIQPRDFAAGDIASPLLPYNQQNLNRQSGGQNWNQSDSFMDLLFRILLNTRR